MTTREQKKIWDLLERTQLTKARNELLEALATFIMPFSEDFIEAKIEEKDLISLQVLAKKFDEAEAIYNKYKE